MEIGFVAGGVEIVVGLASGGGGEDGLVPCWSWCGVDVNRVGP